MKLVAPFAILLATVGLAEAFSLNPGLSELHSRHNKVARQHEQIEARSNPVVVARRSNSKKRCSVKTKATSAPVQNAAPSPPAESPSSKAPSSSKSTHAPAATSPAPQSSSGGLIQVTSPVCGASGATKQITDVSGPNGHIDWLNCGIDKDGWQPPPVHVKDVIAQDLSTALDSASSPFHACKAYISQFQQYADEFGIPAILVASIAMQESSCNPGTVGGGGEQGLMQITKDKCGGAPGGDCKNVDYNIRTGVKYFSDTLNSNNGNLLLTIGMYNGWTEGLTIAEATKAAQSSCCRCQNNLDYLDQTMNGWMQNVNPYTMNMGKYHNLDQCSN